MALDLEAAGFHRYSDRVCLLQVSTGDQNFVIDTLAVEPSDVLRALWKVQMYRCSYMAATTIFGSWTGTWIYIP